MRQTVQRFLKGINRRLPVDRAEPGTLYTLQNARLWVRGATALIKRIFGFSVWDTYEYNNVVAMTHANGKIYILKKVDLNLDGLYDESDNSLLTEDNIQITL